MAPIKAAPRRPSFTTPSKQNMEVIEPSIEPSKDVQEQLNRERPSNKRVRLSTMVRRSPDQTKVINHHIDRKHKGGSVLTNRQLSALLCPQLHIKDTYFPKMHNQNAANTISFDTKLSMQAYSANENMWHTLVLFPAKDIHQSASKGNLAVLVDSVNKLTAPISVNNLASPTFPNGFETLSTATNPVRSGYTAFYNGGSYKLTANNTCSNPAIVTIWVLTPRRPMEDITLATNQSTLMPLQMSARDKHTEALVSTIHGTATWPNPTLNDAHTTTKLISDDVDDPGDIDFKIKPTDKTLHYHYKVSQSKTFTLNAGDTLNYQVDFQPFQFEDSSWAVSNNHDLMPFCTKILLIRVHGKSMMSRTTADAQGTISYAPHGPTQLVWSCTEKHNMSKVPVFHGAHQTIVNNDMNKNNQTSKFYDIDPNEETIGLLDILAGTDAN